MTPYWGPYGPRVESMLLSVSGGKAISGTFAEDGMKPETCHLCFTALSLKTCMCAHVLVCIHVCHHAWRQDVSHHGTCFAAGGRAAPSEKRCVCVQGRGGGGGDGGGILCV